MELGDRKKYIGGSDIAVIMGDSRWKTPLRLWAEKTGRFVQDEKQENEYIYWGNKHEATIAEEFAKRTGMIVSEGKEYSHKRFPMFIGHTDRTIGNDEAILECKTSSKDNEWKDGLIPKEYQHQLNWYMGLSGIHKGYFACLITGNKFVMKELVFNPELYDNQIQACIQFWDMVSNDIMPEVTADDADTLLRLYPNSNKESITLHDDELDNDIAYLSEKEIELKEIEKEVEAIKNEIKMRMGENEYLITDKYTVSWKSQETSRVDIEKLKKDGLFESYSKTTNSRVLRKTKRSV